MNTNDIIHETMTALAANKIRTGLTMLGIVIGIASVISMTAIGTGAQKSIESSIQTLGSNLIQVFPGAQRGPGGGPSAGRGSSRTLTNEDADAIVEQVAGITAASYELQGRYQVVARGTNTNTSVVGTSVDYPRVRNLAIAEGSFFSESHALSGAKVAILGPTVAKDLFPNDTALGQKIRINKIEFTVIGISVAKGGQGFQNQDDMIFVPIVTAQRFLAGDRYLSTLALQAESSEVMSQVQTDVTTLLLERHRIADTALADFTVMNQNDLLSTVSSVTQTFTILLAAIAGISLLVGGIGIMNMMLTSVTERTREIGLRKAIGARRKDISRQFLAEAIALTVLGGIIGMLLGSSIALGLNALGILQTSVSLTSVLVAFSICAGIGILFGYYPARRAAELNPIDALRYE